MIYVYVYVWARRGNIGGSLGATRQQQFRGQQQQLQHPFRATVKRNGSKTCAKRPARPGRAPFFERF
eukprot:scaffold76198_cov51-Phaeocystis_antarctica.AAC.2